MLRKPTATRAVDHVGGLVRTLLNAPRSRRRSIAAAALGALALVGSLLVATPAQALNDTGTGGVFTAATGRILDTAKGTGGFSTPMEAGKYRTIKVTGLAGVPDDGTVGAVSLNATVGTAPGYGTLFGRPDADTSRTSMLIYNGNTGEYVSNTATVAVGADGTIQIMAETSARVILDVQGYYTANTDGTAAGGFVPVAGKRFVDTRSGLGAPKATIAPGKSVDVQVTGANGVPAGASGAVVNLIAINSTSSDGNLTPYATGSTKPQNSLHYTPSATTSIQAQVGLSADGKMTIANASSTVNLVIDLQGYFTAAGKTGAVFTPGVGRAYDSRATGNTILAKNETRSIQIAGKAGVPVMGSGITAVVLTLIVAHGGSDGRAAVWADGATKPDTTSINFQADEIRTNTVTVPLGTNGKVSLNNVADATNYVIDVQGWYINPIAPTIDCPQPYGEGTWTNVLPSSAVNCTVKMPNTGDSSGILTVNVNGESVVESALSETAGTVLTVPIPPTPGWYTIEATSSYSAGVGDTTSYGLGLNSAAPSATVAAVQAANPTGFERVATGSQDSASIAATTQSDANEADSASIAVSPRQGITIAVGDQSASDPDGGEDANLDAASVNMGLPYGSRAAAGIVESPGIVSYHNTNFSTLAVLKTDASVQISTVIENGSAPTAYPYALDIPTGGHATLQDDGVVLIVDSSGTPIGGVAPAWARDAAGNKVSTRYELNGSVLTQIVDLSSTTTYPVVADPYLGINVIDRVKWVKRSKLGKTLYVYPTVWGRSMAGLKYADLAGWAEVVKKAPSANTKNMWWQYKCHAQVAYWKPSWNLDSFLRRSSYSAYTSNLCN